MKLTFVNDGRERSAEHESTKNEKEAGHQHYTVRRNYHRYQQGPRNDNPSEKKEVHEERPGRSKRVSDPKGEEGCYHYLTSVLQRCHYVDSSKVGIQIVAAPSLTEELKTLLSQNFGSRETEQSADNDSNLQWIPVQRERNGVRGDFDRRGLQPVIHSLYLLCERVSKELGEYCHQIVFIWPHHDLERDIGLILQSDLCYPI
jgi:hypothetical protein